MDDCTCTPGTLANGWHETRCAHCAAADRQEWVSAMQRGRAMREEVATIAAVEGISYHEGLEVWRRHHEYDHQRRLYRYLGMDRAGDWR